MLSLLLTRLFGHPVDWTVVAHWVGWNVFLAVIPVFLGYAILWLVRTHQPVNSILRVSILSLLFVVWLAFVPNTCYLLTEWRHFLSDVVNSDLYRADLSAHAKLRLVGQALFFLFYSGAGALCFVLAIRPVERALRLSRVPFPGLAVPLFVLISLGVYLGLILRLNSWDIVTRPDHVLRPITLIPSNPLLIAAIVAFALLLWALYEGLDIWVDGMAQRWEEWLPKSSIGRARRH